MLTAKDNKAYKEIITRQACLFMKINENVQKGAADLVNDLIPSEFSDQYAVLLQMWVFFLRENQTGPSAYTKYVDEEKAPVDHYTAELPEFELDNMSTKNKEMQDSLVEEFSLKGETFYNRVQFLIVLKMIGVWLGKMSKDGDEQAFIVHLWTARHAWTHQQILSNNIDDLQVVVISGFDEAMKILRKTLPETGVDTDAAGMKKRR